MEQLPGSGGKTKLAMAGTAVVAFLAIQFIAGMAIDMVLTVMAFGVGYLSGKMTK